MTESKLKRRLMGQLINARNDLDAYLQLRKAKGYMSVSDNDHLRTNLLELCGELRRSVIALKRSSSPTELDIFRQAGEAIASAAVCLMSGRYDCPSYIAVNVVTLDRCLAALAKSIQKLDAESSMTLA
ncbi:biofilm formation regulator BssR [Kluyvera cryocrescens]|uniref:biofilm formation regulator BssR n=1 Tax=Kluyvera cryocrescens TaxID=580 RepID=UPI00224B4B26|nr:biofilm formation regulator BssR [Kluyvera cryocrescens]MCX2867567.1 biofilm formation regulator BssR [Kluyvera cryocrescens]